MDNETHTTETAHDDVRIVGMMASLPRVAAPADFDVRVRARIANRKSAERTGFRLPSAVAYGIALGIVLVAFGFFGIVWMYGGKADGVPAVATVDDSAEIPRNFAISNDRPGPVADSTVASSRATSEPEAERPHAAEIKREVNVTQTPEIKPDSARKKARTIYPKGIDPSLRAEPLSNAAERGKPIQVKELLSFLGVGSAFTDGGWRVESVKANSTAERIGLKPGDVIVAINDQAVDATTSFTGSFTGKSLRILRDGRNVHFDLVKK